MNKIIYRLSNIWLIICDGLSAVRVDDSTAQGTGYVRFFILCRAVPYLLLTSLISYRSKNQKQSSNSDGIYYCDCHYLLSLPLSDGMLWHTVGGVLNWWGDAYYVTARTKMITNTQDQRFGWLGAEGRRWGGWSGRRTEKRENAGKCE